VGRDPRHDILFEPVQIGPKTLRNRFYQVPHCTGFGTRKPGSQAEHRAIKAEGGWAALCTEYAPVSFDSDESPYVSAQLWDDEDAANLALMCERVHEHGALAGIELTHSGVHAQRPETRWVAIAPSQLGGDYHASVVPKEMELEDIRRVQADWAAAARRGAAAGFDIVYVYGGHSYLLSQFLSPFYNKRTDAYGGSLENRARMWLETLAAVRDAVGDQCAIAVRIGVDLTPGIGVEDALAFVRLADPLVDLWDVNVGSIVQWSHDSGASRFFEEGYQLEWTSRVREATAKPIVGVSRLTNPDRMAEIVRSGVWDLIGAARPSIADPFLPRKIEEGRYGEVRECIGCNVCIAKGDHLMHLGCTQNATAGEEFRRGWHPERFEPAANRDRDVLVVGAGPAGMECAIVLGKRGFRRVHLVEAEQELGGVTRWVPRLPGLGEWGRVLNWRRIQLERLKNVEVLTGLRLDADGVREYGAELVVVATGSRWCRDGLNAQTHEPIPGADASQPWVLTPEQVVLQGKRPPGRRVVVYDADGYFMAPGLAEQLVLDGFEVELVTPFDVISPESDHTLEGPLLRRRLHEAGIRLTRNVLLTRIAEHGAQGESEFGEAWEREADAVVLVTQRRSDDALYRELRADEERLREEGVEAVFRIGDCVAPGLIADAVFSGHRLAREIDSPDPSLPLPHRRELPAAARAVL
jgi:dimethylamine/trimethylamine dehydrogenase